MEYFAVGQTDCRARIGRVEAALTLKTEDNVITINVEVVQTVLADGRGFKFVTADIYRSW